MQGIECPALCTFTSDPVVLFINLVASLDLLRKHFLEGRSLSTAGSAQSSFLVVLGDPPAWGLDCTGVSHDRGAFLTVSPAPGNAGFDFYS